MNTAAHHFTRRSRRHRHPARGFTLIETALATIIVGVGVLALVSLQGGLHMKNRWSTHAGTATRLGNEIREMTLNLNGHDPVTDDAYWGVEPNETLWVGDFDDIDDFDGVGAGITFSAEAGNGPINARREVIANMDGWSQTVTVEKVNPFDIREAAGVGEEYVLRVTVSVSYQGPNDDAPDEVTSVTWLAPE